MPNYLGGGQPFIATDPRAFAENMRANRQVDNQTRQVDMQEKQYLMEAMDKQEQKRRQKDIDEALEASMGLLQSHGMEDAPAELKYMLSTSVHAKDKAGVVKAMDELAKWQMSEKQKGERAKQGQAIFPTRTMGPVEPVDTERLALQSAYAQGGMGDVSKYAEALKDMRAATTDKNAEKLPKMGELRKFHLGDKEVTEEWNGTGWAPKSEGPRYKPEPPVTINFDKEVIKQNIKALPKLKEGARTAKSGIDRIDKMLGLIEKGAGGRIGQAKAWLNPTLEVFGIRNQGYSDAQLYQILARTLGGSMRMEIIGPGQVSDYENRLMAAVSGGGGTGTEAAKELLLYYRNIAEGKINDYNDAVSLVGDASPASKKSNRPVTTSAPEKKRYKFNPATGQLE